MPDINFRHIKETFIVPKNVKCYNVILENWTALILIGLICWYIKALEILSILLLEKEEKEKQKKWASFRDRRLLIETLVGMDGKWFQSVSWYVCTYSSAKKTSCLQELADKPQYLKCKEEARRAESWFVMLVMHLW